MHTAFAASLPDDKRFDLLYLDAEAVEAVNEPLPYAIHTEVVKSRIAAYVGADAAYITSCIESSSARYGVDPLLVTALLEQESGFRVYARSPAGAIGIAQLMPDTATALQVNPYNLEENIDGGVKYLSYLLERYASYGQLCNTLAIAAYNAGPKVVDRLGAVPNFAETRKHVSAVAKNYEALLLKSK